MTQTSMNILTCSHSFSEVNGPHIINWTWVTPVEDTAPYIFEFMNAGQSVSVCWQNKLLTRKQQLDRSSVQSAMNAQ